MTEYKLDGTRWRSAYKRDGTRCPRETPATLDEAGETALTNAKAAIAKYDPDGTALKFAFISDLHRSENSEYAGNSGIDDRYSLRLLSRLCDDVALDAIFCGGDIVNARSENSGYVQKNMQDVVDDFDELMPHTNIFFACGNHDKRYGETSGSYRASLNTNEFLHNLWDQVQYDGNGVELHYIDSTNFYVDFARHKVRIIFINQYDGVDSNSDWYANEDISSSTGIHTHGSTVWHSALPTTDKADWFVGVVYHGADFSSGSTVDQRMANWWFTDLKDTLQAYVDGGGKGSLGAIAGHWHQATAWTVLPSLNVAHVGCAYATAAQAGLATAYCVSVFVVDSETGYFREIRIGREAQIINYDAYKHGSNNGLLQNGTCRYPITFTVSNGDTVRFETREKAYCNGINLTNLAKNGASNPRGDKVTSDTANVLFSAVAGDKIRTEITFSDDSTNSRQIKVFSPQLTLIPTQYLTTGGTITNEIELTEDVDVTAVGIYWYGNTGETSNIPLGFELNIYKNGVKMVRSA